MRCFPAKPRATIGWGLLGFAGLQLALTACVDQCWPALRDAQYGRKLALLETACAEHPNRRLLLMLGSSRTAVGFRPDVANRPATVFNFGLPAAGPLKERQLLQALLDRGIRPDSLLIEIMPPLFNEAGPDRFCEENWLDVPGLAAADMFLLQTYFSHPPQMGLAWARSRLLPCYRLRRRLLTPLAPDWRTPRPTALPTAEIDGFGWQRLACPILSEEERTRPLERARQTYAGAFRDFRLGAGPCRALNDLLDRCAGERIPVVLIWMPECTVFRGWYTAEAAAALEQFLAKARDRRAARFLDARAWIADEDFWDGHHLLPTGARQFTRRLMRALEE